MITNLRLETSDEDRNYIAMYLERNSATKRLATRKEITELVQQTISDIVTRASQGEYDADESVHDDGGHRRDLSDDGPAGDQGLPEHGNPEPNFRPSRGDEPYLFTARDPALKDIHSRFLDLAQELEDYTWEQMEKNREK